MIFYTGSYTNKFSPARKPTGQGISCLDLNLENGKVKLLHFTKLRNPSYLTIARDGKYLYALEELPESQNPHVFCFEIAENGQLILINSQKLTGDYACYLTVIGDQLIVTNYGTGNALVFSILQNGSITPYHQIIEHCGTGTDTIRQEGPHMHMVYCFYDNYMFLLDLGIDKANAYHLNEHSTQWKPAPAFDLSFESGIGVRHLVMNDSKTHAFVLSEMSGEIFVFKRHGSKFEQIQKISSLPKGFNEKASGAAIRFHPNGRLLYISDRGSDSIGIFKLDKLHKSISLVGHQSTEGNIPRDFNIDPTGKWLVVANQDSNSLIIFDIDSEKGLLHKKSSTSIKTPVNICWSC